MSIHAACLRVLMLATTATLAVAPSARAQDENTLALGVSYAARMADASGAHGTRGVGLAWRFGHGGTGWGWAAGLGWFSADISRSIGGESTDLGEVHVRPLMAGYGYKYSFGRTSVSAELIGGYAFVSFDQGPAASAAYRDRLGAQAVTLHTSNTFALRPQTSVWIDMTKRFGLNLSAGYVIARPRLTIRSSLGEQSVRLNTNMTVVSAGIVYKIF
jgi:hypothetical protein